MIVLCQSPIYSTVATMSASGDLVVDAEGFSMAPMVSHARLGTASTTLDPLQVQGANSRTRGALMHCSGSRRNDCSRAVRYLRSRSPECATMTGGAPGRRVTDFVVTHCRHASFAVQRWRSFR